MMSTGRYLAFACTCLLVSACTSYTGSRVASLPPSPTRPVDQRTLGPMQIDPTRPDGEQTAEGTPGEQGVEATGDQPTDGDTSAAGLAAGAGQTDGTAVAALATPPPGADANANLGRADLLGGWKLISGSDQCQLFMNLTAWQGGYRATTRGCSSPALQNISAWDLSGNQITLKDGNGAAIGSAFPTGENRFAGRTAGGKELAFFR